MNHLNCLKTPVYAAAALNKTTLNGSVITVALSEVRRIIALYKLVDVFVKFCVATSGRLEPEGLPKLSVEPVGSVTLKFL